MRFRPVMSEVNGPARLTLMLSVLHVTSAPGVAPPIVMEEENLGVWYYENLAICSK